MSAQFELIKSQRLVILTLEGSVNLAELESTGVLILAHPDFEPNFSQIIDCTRLGGVNFSVDTIRRISRDEKTFSPTAMRIIVAPQDHIYGLARMAQVFAERTIPNMVVVRTMDEAREALNKAK
jgi:hypothetical protein